MLFYNNTLWQKIGVMNQDFQGKKIWFKYLISSKMYHDVQRVQMNVNMQEDRGNYFQEAF